MGVGSVYSENERLILGDCRVDVYGGAVMTENTQMYCQDWVNCLSGMPDVFCQLTSVEERFLVM